MTNPNYIPQWPLYKDSDGVYIRALPIKAIDYANDGSAQVEFDGAYNDQYISAAFIGTFKPEVGGYLFNSQYGEILYLSKADFEAKYTKDTSEGGYTLPAATTSTLGGVKQGVAVADAAGDTPTKAEFTALLASLRASGAIAS
ncbi:head fiber protein [Tatumella sp. OPLPL6]|uniref:head fiber protein n=1 Tax=Tatumella sp. OPLPL6 TaxID=1928657 RepID=UPI001AEFA437|nr:head fiber protein [Tatumella sp. OPLPL6]